MEIEKVVPPTLENIYSALAPRDITCILHRMLYKDLSSINNCYINHPQWYFRLWVYAGFIVVHYPDVVNVLISSNHLSSPEFRRTYYYLEDFIRGYVAWK